MSTELWHLIIILTVIFLYGGAIVGSIMWVRSRRKTKWPFKDGDKLLRGPGESLRRKVLTLDESFITEFGGGIFVLLLALGICATVGSKLGWSAPVILTSIGITLAIVIGLSAWRFARLWRRRANNFLGWFGERLTAEKIQPLTLQGYRLFHDVPAESGKNAFNVDHVAIGPTGVFAIEVKTRRKGNARPGLKDHEVRFDGTALDWPRGRDQRSVQQAVSQAAWLSKWIFVRTGLRVEAKPILAIPGWYVHEAPSPQLRVVHPEILPEVIKGRGTKVLTPEQIDLIARQLDLQCRDVEE